MLKSIYLRVFLCILLIGFLVFVVIQRNISLPTIGEVYGPENEYIQIGNDTYTACYDPGIKKERNKKIGKVVFRNGEDIDPMVVYTLKGYDDKEYIYTLWVYDGTIYKKDTK